MKISFYVDIYSWTSDSPNVWAVSNPSQPVPNGATRYKFSVEFPDPKKPDVDLGEVEIDGEVS